MKNEMWERYAVIKQRKKQEAKENIKMGLKEEKKNEVNDGRKRRKTEARKWE